MSGSGRRHGALSDREGGRPGSQSPRASLTASLSAAAIRTEAEAVVVRYSEGMSSSSNEGRAGAWRGKEQPLHLQSRPSLCPARV
jgi:hypothetical protein